MKKSLPLFFCLILLYSTAKAQDNRVNIDYQYSRIENEYHAYTMFAKVDEKKSVVDIELVTTLSFNKLKNISIKKGDRPIQLSFNKIDTVTKTDDENLKSLVITVDLKSILNSTIDCETILFFLFEDGNKIALPFRFCLAKEKLKTLNL